MYLYEHGYAEDIILAGLLHDALEWASVSKEMLQEMFGERVLTLVLASTKDDSILDKKEKTKELIRRCSNGQGGITHYSQRQGYFG